MKSSEDLRIMDDNSENMIDWHTKLEVRKACLTKSLQMKGKLINVIKTVI